MDQITIRKKALKKKHRKDLALQLAFLSACLLLLVGMLTQVLSVEGVDFPNPLLKNAVRKKLGPGIITKTSVSKIRKLDLTGYGFENLDGIEALWNLRSLNLTENYVRDLKPLAGLEHLKELDLSFNNVYSLEGLEELCNLEKLNLTGNIVRDLSPLKNLHKLKELNLNYNDISTLDAVNIQALADCPLEILRLRDNYRILEGSNIVHLNKVDGVEALQNLKRLDLRYNKVQDLKPISRLQHLENLDLRENDISDISELSKLKSLRKLNLRGNALQDIEPLRGLEELSYLNLHSNTLISSIEPIQALVEMDTLIVRNVNIGDELHYLAGMKKLHRVNLQNCGITDPQVLLDLMLNGALQDGKKKSQRAEIDLLNNDLQYRDFAQYTQLKDLWDNISLKAPFALPRPINEDLEITLSHPSGFYEEEFDLTITCNDPNARILYTLDGSEPDVDNIGGGKPYYVDYYNPRTWKPSEMFGSPLRERRNVTYEYTDPIRIKDRTHEPNDLASIITTYGRAGFRPFKYHIWRLPKNNILKSTVIKTAFFDGNSYNRTLTNSYFVFDNITFDMPIISIVTDPKNLFDFNNGIYVPGRYYFESGGTASIPLPFQELANKPNYAQKGKYWERQAQLEMYDGKSTALFKQNVGLRTQGGASRINPQKAIRIIAKDSRGKNSLFLKDLIDPNNAQYPTQWGLSSFVLRTGGSSRDLIRDAFAQSVASTMNIDTQRTQPAIQFVNGEYWGVCNIRDRYNADYIAHNHNVDVNNIIMIYEPRTKLYDDSKVKIGDINDKEPYNDIHRFVFSNDLSKPENYDYLCSVIDMNSYIDYNIAMMYLANMDWYGTRHFRMWKTKNKEESGDSAKWRFMIWDLDQAFGHKAGFHTDLIGENLGFLKPAQYQNDNAFNGYTRLFSRLSENDQFQQAFVERSLHHINSTFNPSFTVSNIDEKYECISSEFKRHKQRWGVLPANERVIRNIKKFMSNREAVFKDQLGKYFPRYFDGDTSAMTP